MSNSEIDRDGFQFVKNKRNSKKKQTKIPEKAVNVQQEIVDIDVDKVIR